MNKKKRFIILLLAAGLFYIFRLSADPWIYDYDDAIRVINQKYPLPEGQIVSYEYDHSGGDQSGNGYICFNVIFENGISGKIRVEVKWHRHLFQEGPDFRIRYCRLAE
ncbi:MAG: hypothetical protein E7186_03010 [Erysipelotrichaceae bacterium]|nr:hypothetical protein [Erysipelotrichaceae bacterium]